MDTSKLKELMENTRFMEKVIEADNPQNVKNMFIKHNINLSDEDMKILSSKIREVAKENGIMPENDLAKVAGGKLLMSGPRISYYLARGAIGGVWHATTGIAGALKRGVSYTAKWWSKILP